MKDTAVPGPIVTRGISDRQESTTYSPSESMADGKTREFFWGCVLTKEHPTTSWNFLDEEDEQDFLEHTLFLKQATLGVGIEDNVKHIVSVETKNYAGDEIIQPIINLTSGKQDMAMLDLIFQYEIPVTFKLVEGPGPVHLSASQLVEFPPELDETETEFDETGTEDELMGEEHDDDDDDHEPEEEEEEEEEVEERGKKRKAMKKGNKSKRGKVEKLPSRGSTDESSEGEDEDDSMDEDDSDMESEEESDYEESPPKKASKKAKGKKKAATPKSKKRGRPTKAAVKKTKGKNK